jgi:inorganic pyrophosphatase
MTMLTGVHGASAPPCGMREKGASSATVGGSVARAGPNDAKASSNDAIATADRYNRRSPGRLRPALPSEPSRMSFDRVPSGADVPNDCNVIIEIPMHGEPIKYEVDKESGAVFVDRFMSTSMHYPCNYGYIPQTLSDDGDPCDVLVLSPVPLITGVVVRCRPIGMLKMDDEAGGDAKILAVPIDKLSSLYRSIESPRDLPEIQCAQIAHFFEHYKDLEPGKWVRLAGWVGAEEAKREIVDSVDRFRSARKDA